jgi:hypothetical protein
MPLRHLNFQLIPGKTWDDLDYTFLYVQETSTKVKN